MLSNSMNSGFVWCRARRWAVYGLLVVSVLLGLTAACGRESSEEPEGNASAAVAAPETSITTVGPLPTIAPSPIPTAGVPTAIPLVEPAPPTATAGPRIFTGPVPASNIPFPTYPTNTPRPLATRIPTLTWKATPTVSPGEHLMDEARKGFTDTTGAAFEVMATLDLDSSSGTEPVSVTYAGDFRLGYALGDVTVIRTNATEHFREVSTSFGLGRVSHVVNPETGSWEPYLESSPYFVDLLTLFGFSERALGDFALSAETSSNGAPSQVLNTVIRNLEIAGGKGDVEASFRIDESTGLVKEVEATGTLHFARHSVLLGDTGGKSATVKITARLFDYGKESPRNRP